ncbi:MAG: substrate-binding domain-containing protein [Alkalinema sp. CAN_BIN05]|nr:substrate-binding domain-containing protein [Alkalinema sp. CAN_BIN05]
MMQNKQLSPRQFGWVCALVASTAPLTISFSVLSTAAIVQSTAIQGAIASTDMTVEKGTKVRVHSSNSMLSMNGALKNKFATQFPGSSVDLLQVSTTKALEDVLAGRADLAAIGRPLTEQEKAQGLVASMIGRDKIAVVVNPKNAFTKDLTIPKFAQIFRGDITDWSQLGGAKGEITFIDRTNSDTRQALAGYPAFKNAPLESGKNSTKLQDTSMKALISSLKGSAVSFVPANQARSQDGLRMLTMDGVLPTSPLYPFSQPLYYVHKSDTNGGMSNPVKAFLGFLGTKGGQSTIRQSGIAQVQKPGPDNVVSIASGEKAAKMEAGGSKVSGTGTEVRPATSEPSGIGNKTGVSKAPNSNDTLAAETDGNLFGLPFPGWLKWLLPLGLLGTGLLLLLLPNKRDNVNTMVRGDDDDRNDSGFGNPRTEAGDAAENPANNRTEILSNTTENWNKNEGVPYIRDETDLNLGDRGTEAVSNAVDGTTRILGNVGGVGGAAAVAVGGMATWEFLKGKGNDGEEAAQDVQNAAITKLSEIKTNLDAPNITVPPVDGPGDFSLDQNWSFDDNVAAGAAIGSTANSDRTSLVGDRSSIVIAPQNAREAVVRWQLTEVQKLDAKQQGGTDFALRLYDVTGINPESEVLENFYQYDCNELSQELRIEVPVPARDYVVEVGYVDRVSEWYGIVRSHSVHIPSA